MKVFLFILSLALCSSQSLADSRRPLGTSKNQHQSTHLKKPQTSSSKIPASPTSSSSYTNTVRSQDAIESDEVDSFYNEVLTNLSLQYPGCRVKVEYDINQKPNKVEMFSGSDEVMGTLKLKIKETTLTVHKIEVKEAYRGKKISELLMARALMEHPRTNRISTEALTQDNQKIFVDSVNAGKTPQEALMSTPAYKMRVKFGFTEIDEKRSKYDPKDVKNIYFETVRPGTLSAAASSSQESGAESSSSSESSSDRTTSSSRPEMPKSVNEVKQMTRPQNLKEKIKKPKLPGW